MKKSIVLLLVVCTYSTIAQTPEKDRWSNAKATTWYAKQPWLFGSNYNPASAINQLEMFQKDSFSPEGIDKELGWAEALGTTTARVYLHDLLWEDKEGFTKRLDQFLDICAKHKIRPMLVLLILVGILILKQVPNAPRNPVFIIRDGFKVPEPKL